MTTNTDQTSAFQLPPDAVLYNNGRGIFAVFNVGGVNISYAVEFMSGLQQFDHSKVQNVSQAQFSALGAVDGGDAEELRAVTSQWGTFGAFFTHIIDSVMPTTNPARQNPDVMRVIAELAGRPDMTPAELQNKLQATSWFQQHTQAQLEWNDLSDAEKLRRTEAVRAQMTQTVWQYAGVQVSPDDPRIANWVDRIASGEKGIGAWTEEVVKTQAATDAGSPWARQVADESKARLQPGVDIENTAARIRDLAARWGVQWSDSTYQDWGRRVTSNDASEADVLQALKDQAQVLYPWKHPDIETQTAASPWVETFKRVMEKDVNMFDPKVQQALSAGTPVWDFEQSLKKSSDWLQTKNAKEELTSVMAEAGRRMGFN